MSLERHFGVQPIPTRPLYEGHASFGAPLTGLLGGKRKARRHRVGDGGDEGVDVRGSLSCQVTEIACNRRHFPAVLWDGRDHVP